MIRLGRQGADAPPLRVLVADDDEEVRQAVKAVLDAVTGLELVGMACDGFEAVRLFSELRPDAVLTDVVMPRCDGIEATKQMLAIEPAARVIAMTGAEDSRMLALCLAAGAKGALRKGPDTLALIPLMLALATPASSPPGSGGSTTEGRHPERDHTRVTRSLAVVVALAFALAAPASADAHIRSGIVATEYRATVRVAPNGRRSAVAARVYPGDRALGLAVARGHVVSVLRSPGASVLRIDARSASRTVSWHDVRLRGLPADIDRRRWEVPLVIDGIQARLSGEIHRVRPPPSWPWLAMGLVFVVGVVLSRRRPLVACGVFAGCAAIATLATAVGFAAGGGATTGRLLEGIDETVFAGVGVGLLLWGRGERQAMAAVGLGFLALVVGSLKLAVLTHGVVLSALGPTAARACVVLALWSGAAAIVSGGWLLAAKPLGPNRSLRFHDRAIDHR